MSNPLLLVLILSAPVLAGILAHLWSPDPEHIDLEPEWDRDDDVGPRERPGPAECQSPWPDDEEESRSA